MLMLLVALAIAAVVAAVLIHHANEGYSGLHMVEWIFGLVLAIATGFASITYVFAGWQWLAAESKAKIINREYGTAYTREEVFFAADVIDTIREIDRKRIEVNGDLLREKSEGETP